MISVAQVPLTAHTLHLNRQPQVAEGILCPNTILSTGSLQGKTRGILPLSTQTDISVPQHLLIIY